MEIEDILSTLIPKFESLKHVLGIFTPEELMYLFGILIITLFLFTNIVACLERTFPTILKILKICVSGLTCFISIMTIIMLGNYISNTDSSIDIDSINNMFWTKANKFSFPIISEEIITWMRTPLNDD